MKKYFRFFMLLFVLTLLAGCDQTTITTTTTDNGLNNEISDFQSYQSSGNYDRVLTTYNYIIDGENNLTYLLPLHSFRVDSVYKEDFYLFIDKEEFQQLDQTIVYQEIDGIKYKNVQEDGSRSSAIISDDVKLNDEETQYGVYRIDDFLLNYYYLFEKIKDGRYRADISVDELIESGDSTLYQLLDLDFFLYRTKVTFTFTLSFDEENHYLMLQAVSSSFVENDTIIHLEFLHLEEVLFDYTPYEFTIDNNYQVTGASAITEYQFPMPSTTRVSMLNLEYGRDNYYQYDLEEGYYMIDGNNRLNGLVNITVYDDLGNEITGDIYYKIEQAGVYHINYTLTGMYDDITYMYVEKVNEDMVGSPTDPIYTGTNFTIDSTEDSVSFLLMDEAPENGLIVITPDSGSILGLYYPKLGVQYSMNTSSFGDGYPGSYHFQVIKGQVVIVSFDFMENTPITCHWEFIPESVETGDSEDLPNFTINEIYLVYVSTENITLNYQFVIPEDEYISVVVNNRFYSEIPANYTFLIYDEEGNLLEYSLGTFYIQAGTYRVEIITSGNLEYTFPQNIDDYNYISFYLMILDTW